MGEKFNYAIETLRIEKYRLLAIFRCGVDFAPDQVKRVEDIMQEIDTAIKLLEQEEW